MLKLEKVTGGYANIPVLKDVTFEVADGELVGLIGLNGAGKSTKAIAMSVLNNNEEVAGQTVFHAHIHLVPRYGSDDGIHMSFDEHEPDFAALANLADSIAKEVTE